MYKIIYSNDAFDDISYIFDNNKFYNTSLKFSKKFYKTINSIIIFPYGGVTFRSKKLNNIYRKTSAGKYNIFYIIDENNKEVLIFRVLHHRRNIDNLLK